MWLGQYNAVGQIRKEQGRRTYKSPADTVASEAAPVFTIKIACVAPFWCVAESLLCEADTNPSVERAAVEAVVRTCPDCASVNPATTGKRLAVDVTHFGPDRFRTIIDCVSITFTIWRKISNEDAMEVSTVLE